MYIENNGIKYIKLRLQDSECWGEILSKLLNREIKIVKDYETMNKPIRDIYLQFKNNYKIPSNFIDEMKECKYLNYFLSREEREQYINQWSTNSSNKCTYFTKDEYKLYEYISLENNNHIAIVQTKHYLDEGCICKACQIKRNHISYQLLNGQNMTGGIYHEEAKNEFMENRIKKMNNFIQHQTTSNKNNNNRKERKNGIITMKTIVGLR